MNQAANKYLITTPGSVGRKSRDPLEAHYLGCAFDSLLPQKINSLPCSCTRKPRLGKLGAKVDEVSL